MGVAPEVLFPVIEAVTAVAKVPVGFKLTPESGYPRMMYLVEEAQKRGIKYVVTTHKYFAVAPPDIWNGGRGRWPAVGGMNPLCDMGGATLPFSMYKATALIAKNLPGIDCFAGGPDPDRNRLGRDQVHCAGQPVALRLHGEVQRLRPVVDAGQCSCCAMCTTICPSGAIRIVPR